jgi:hypothetical protein
VALDRLVALAQRAKQRILDQPVTQVLLALQAQQVLQAKQVTQVLA